VSDASFEAWGGRASGSLRVALGGTRTQPFALSLRVEDADAGPFFRTVTSSGSEETEDALGTLDLELDLTGSTDPQLLPVAEDLQGSASVTLTDGRLTGTGLNAALSDFLESEEWMGIPFSRLAGDVVIRERAMEIREGELVGGLARFAFRGPVLFNGEADVSMALAVPADQLQHVSLRRTGVGSSVVDQLKNAGNPLDLGLHVVGFLSAPTLEPNAANALGLAER
jgi:hypothetical protein